MIQILTTLTDNSVSVSWEQSSPSLYFRYIQQSVHGGGPEQGFSGSQYQDWSSHCGGADSWEGDAL